MRCPYDSYMPDAKFQDRPPHPLPRWLKRNVPKGNANHFTARLIDELGLQTVCDHARCPNRMECYAQKTATMMILGEVCTRACRFCSVRKGRPQPPDAGRAATGGGGGGASWPAHVVVTCVTRDDLPDGGAGHFVQTIAELLGRAGRPSKSCPPTSPATQPRSIASSPPPRRSTTTTRRLCRGSIGRSAARRPITAGPWPCSAASPGRIPPSA